MTTGATQSQDGTTSHEIGGTEVEGVITKVSPRPVSDTVDRLIGMVQAKGMKVFAVIDHSGEAERVGLQLRNTKLVIFGSPTAGTPVMVATPLVALDLPLKILVWADGEQTKVSYTAPSTLRALTQNSPELLMKIPHPLAWVCVAES